MCKAGEDEYALMLKINDAQAGRSHPPPGLISLKGIRKKDHLMKTSSPFHISASYAHVVTRRDVAGLETRDKMKEKNKERQ